MKANKRKYADIVAESGDEQLKQHLHRTDAFAEVLKEDWEHAGASGEANFDKEKMFRQIIGGEARHNTGAQRAIDGKSSGGKVVRMLFFRKYAAVLVLGLFVLSAAVFFALNGNGLIRSGRMITELGAGNGRELVLEDGSIALLNEGAVLRYPKSFEKESRVVEMEGEVYFEVARDLDRPFIVDVSGLEIEVLGTKFNVSAPRGGSTVVTKLFSGKVRISRENPGTHKVQSVVLTPGHKAVFYEDEERFVMDKNVSERFPEWASARISFDNELFSAVANRIERRYDKEIVLTDAALGELRISLQIDEEPLDEVLLIISKALSLEYKEEGEVVTFYRSE